MVRGRAWGLLLAAGVVLGGGLVFVAITGLGSWRQVDPARGTFVVGVVDGDTIRVSIDGRTDDVRLLGIDTPETVHPTRPVECFGPEASARTHDLLAPGTAVVLERDTEERDHYGRLLAYVVRADDGLFVNLALVREGLAEVLTIAPNVAHTDAFLSAAAEARREGRGLWSACPGAVPSGP
ncbi:thermonuclease family protein [Rhabdothermincola salaria]|uniref:thermonuclease family protein n=1 Tax=Rhabdothermincola salaria TaxID=2903142 RepID=UPI001E2F8EE5|nr:thermonuclease family protein [Rhabdothermincola salaria]MCD9623571.1 thermonuclease family protein [Rhabdothermincola salaria]